MLGLFFRNLIIEPEGIETLYYFQGQSRLIRLIIEPEGIETLKNVFSVIPIKCL